MDKHEKESFFDFEIRQKWKVSNFLPAPQNQASEQDVSFEDFAIEECIGSEDRDWNVPEMLIEFRMAA